MSTEKDLSTGKRRWRPWKVLLVTLVCLISIYVGYQWWHHQQMNARLEAAIAAADVIDPNWRWADMVREYEKLPASPNFPQLFLPWRGYLGWFGDDIGGRLGAIDYDRDGKHFPVRFPEPYFKILKERLEVSGVTGPTVMRDALKLMAQEPILCKVPFEDSNLPQNARNASNYLLDEMELSAHLGKEDSLVSQLQSQLRLCRYLMATPKPINILVGMNLGRQGESGIKRALALGTLSATTLMRCQKILEAEVPFDLNHLLRSLRAEQFTELEGARSDSVKRQKLKDLFLDPYLQRSTTWENRVYYWWKWLEMEFSLNSLALAQAEVLERGNEIIALAKANPAALTRFDPSQLPLQIPYQFKKVKNLVVKQYLQTWCRLATAELSTQAERRALIAALACERYRLAIKSYPETLNDLVPAYLSAVPIDPYSGTALLYRRLPDRVVVYSVGKDGKDDGGEVLNTITSPKDRGVKLFNPEHRGKKYEELPTETKQP
ncbi:MAG TPA: hypothetical protein PLN21_01295 [Gemmatales bacterium]|nr:hypothetical protein [Gemmatales bacterium]